MINRNLLPLALLLVAGCGGGGSVDSTGPIPGPGARSKWTILVYMNAANDLSPFDAANVSQMESVTSPDVRFVVQWKQARGSWDDRPEFTGTRRYLVQPNNAPGVQSEVIQDLGTGVDMGDAATLRQFVDWGRATFPSDRVGVVVWNHGNGWRRSVDRGRGVSYDDETGNHVDTWQLKSALGTGLDFVAWDSSLMQMIEVNYELRGVTPFAVGSQESPPGAGYPYQRVFAPFRANPDGDVATLLRGFVDGILAEPSYAERKITQSVVRVSALDALRNSLDALAVLLPRLDAATVIAVREAAQGYSNTADRTYRDIGSLMDEIDARTSDALVEAATARVRTAYAAAIVHEGNNDRSPRSTGLAIDFSDAASFNSTTKKADYARLFFGREGSWDEWLTVAP